LPLPLLAQSGRAFRFETCLLLRPKRKPVVRIIDSVIRHPSLPYRRVTRSFSSGAHPRASFYSADRSYVICPTGCLAKFLSSPRAKNISLFRLVETGIERSHPVPLRGALRERHGRRGGMRWTRRRARRAMPMRTAKSCGPDTPTLVSSWRSNPLMTVANKPGHRGEHEGNR
jgi:hypothetical protein